jgi:hypothetical protein
VYTNRKNNKQSLAPKTNLQISKDAYYYQNGETRVTRSQSANPSKDNKNQSYMNEIKGYQSISQSIVTTVQYKPSKAIQGNSAKSFTYKS